MTIRSLRLQIGKIAPRRRRGKLAAGMADGFTLLEVLVALTILSIALVPLVAIFSGSLSRAHEIRQETGARALAQSLLAEQSVSGPNVGSTYGRSGDFMWRTAVTPYGDPQLGLTQAALLATTVGWTGSKRTVTLSTLLLLPKASP